MENRWSTLKWDFKPPYWTGRFRIPSKDKSEWLEVFKEHFFRWNAPEFLSKSLNISALDKVYEVLDIGFMNYEKVARIWFDEAIRLGSKKLHKLEQDIINKYPDDASLIYILVLTGAYYVNRANLKEDLEELRIHQNNYKTEEEKIQCLSKAVSTILKWTDGYANQEDIERWAQLREDLCEFEKEVQSSFDLYEEWVADKSYELQRKINPKRGLPVVARRAAAAVRDLLQIKYYKGGRKRWLQDTIELYRLVDVCLDWERLRKWK